MSKARKVPWLSFVRLLTVQVSSKEMSLFAHAKGRQRLSWITKDKKNKQPRTMEERQRRL